MMRMLAQSGYVVKRRLSHHDYHLVRQHEAPGGVQPPAALALDPPTHLLPSPLSTSFSVVAV